MVFTAAMLVGLIVLSSQGKVGAGDVAMLLIVAFTRKQQFWFIADQFVLFNEAWNKCRQGLEVIAAPHEIVDASAAKPLLVRSGEIAFEAISFAYPGRQRIFNCKNVAIEVG